jgi:DNA (cytosine-5)-methyltransferase 1
MDSAPPRRQRGAMADSGAEPQPRAFYEFFAGGGMARAGLGERWTCLFANDFDPKKGESYRANWGDAGELHIGDVHALTVADLPGQADLVWGSFPCQDLSLAGAGAGLKGDRSGTFYPFWRLVTGLAEDGRAPRLVAVENVCGTLTSHSGQDFEAICKSFARGGYRFGALVINADLFVPQSRPRLFIVGVRADIQLDRSLLSSTPLEPFHTPALRQAAARLPKAVRDRLVWWNVPTPAPRRSAFADLVEASPNSMRWHSAEETRRLLDLMSPTNLAKVEAAKAAGRPTVGGVYRRTRPDASGRKIQRAEVRFDDVAGCLRTPAGGSSRQTLLVVDGQTVRSRLISARETARLMGLPDSYELPQNYNDAA